MCPIEATCLPTNCCFSELALQAINLACWSSIKRISFSHFGDRTGPIFSDLRFSYLSLVQDKKITCVLPGNACCTVYVNCSPPPPTFSMHFLFKINSSRYISFKSFINTQILNTQPYYSLPVNVCLL